MMLSWLPVQDNLPIKTLANKTLALDANRSAPAELEPNLVFIAWK